MYSISAAALTSGAQSIFQHFWQGTKLQASRNLNSFLTCFLFIYFFKTADFDLQAAVFLEALGE